MRAALAGAAREPRVITWRGVMKALNTTWEQYMAAKLEYLEPLSNDELRALYIRQGEFLEGKACRRCGCIESEPCMTVEPGIDDYVACSWVHGEDPPLCSGCS